MVRNGDFATFQPGEPRCRLRCRFVGRLLDGASAAHCLQASEKRSCTKSRGMGKALPLAYWDSATAGLALARTASPQVSHLSVLRRQYPG